MLDQLDLVHMNGRIYDPQLARFMSADPIIQDPTHSQSYNRYTYVWNNPTNLTDPTGFVAATQTLVQGNTTTTYEEQTVDNCPKGRICYKDGDGGNHIITKRTQKNTENGTTTTADWTGGKGPVVSTSRTASATNNVGSSYADYWKGVATGFANAFISMGENMPAGGVWAIGAPSAKEINGGMSYQFSEDGTGTFVSGVFVGAMIAPTPGGKLKVLKEASILERVLEHGAGFKTFDKLKQVLTKGNGEQIHHIVEQTASNLSKFGPEAIHNTANVVPLMASTHIGKGSISAYYSSRGRLYWRTNGKAVA